MKLRSEKRCSNLRLEVKIEKEWYHSKMAEEWMFDARKKKIKIKHNPKLQQPFSRDVK